MLYHAHVQHPKGSGYMMQTGSFHNVEEAVARYLELVDANLNPFGRNALLRNPEPLQVLLIPRDLRGPDAMAYTGFCNVWNEDASNAYPAEQPEYVSVPNPRFKGKQYPTHHHSGAGLHGYLYQDGPHSHETYEEAVESLVETYKLGTKRARVLHRDGYLDLNLRRDGNEYAEVVECTEEDCWGSDGLREDD